MSLEMVSNWAQLNIMACGHIVRALWKLNKCGERLIYRGSWDISFTVSISTGLVGWVMFRRCQDSNRFIWHLSQKVTGNSIKYWFILVYNKFQMCHWEWILTYTLSPTKNLSNNLCKACIGFSLRFIWNSLNIKYIIQCYW